MSAGESAYDVARRQREKAERLQRSAALWEQGAEGEVAVARALAALPEGWIVLHDLAWPGRQRANLDHVVVGPGGVFVVDAKNWSGRVEVRDQVLRQNGRQREQTVVSAAEAAIALQGIVPPPAYCMGVLCFVRDEPLTGWARDVMVCSTGNLTSMLLSRPSVLSAEDVRRSVDAITLMTMRPSPVSGPPRNVRQPMPRREAAKRRRGRPVAFLVGVAVLLAAALGGGLATAGDWVGERVVEVIAPSDPVEPTPSQPAKQREQKQQKNNQLDGDERR
ncbi:MAG TPA: NERD domain-containing protein [Nocardioides sp.]|nr:NERD domain-containing protein [Nocardioides sp.]